MKVSVIIPQYRHYELLHQVLFDLYKYCRESIDEVIVMDDASNDKDLAIYFIDGMMIRDDLLPVRVIKNEENLGFLKTCNRGAKEATGDIIVLLSNDVRVKDNFIENLKSLLREEPKSLVGNRLISWDSGWNTFNGRTFPYLEGWLIACTKEAWEDLGGFDEQYGSSDFEDVDISTTAVSKGYLLLTMDNPKVNHIGAQSYGYNPKREERTKKNRKLFEEKWVK